MRLQAAGKIRHVGVSNFGVEQLREALAVPGVRISVNQVCYNLLFRAAELDVIPFCAAHGIRLICYSPLQQALLTGRWATADEVPTYRARSRHFSGTRPKSRHGEEGHEQLTFETVKALKALCEEWGLEMSDLAIACVVLTFAACERRAHTRRGADRHMHAHSAKRAHTDAHSAYRCAQQLQGNRPTPTASSSTRKTTTATKTTAAPRV